MRLFILDEVIRRKLLIDCDGMGDDRRITMLLKTFNKWCMTDEPEEDCRQTYERMMSQLAQCEFAMTKSQLVSVMNKAEMGNYESLYKNIEQAIEEAHKDIATRKHDLVQAKRIRKNRQEYDALARVITQHPDRQATLSNLTSLHKELDKLKQTRQSLEDKLEIRRKQFHGFLNSAYELTQLIESTSLSLNKRFNYNFFYVLR
uniref:THO complex subunit 7 homolog n=1 Tax=Strigamia maritima TaxID=126957 RepID=T1J0H4_STRMM